MQTSLNLSYLCAKTDGVGTKKLTAKEGGKKIMYPKQFFSSFEPICWSQAEEAAPKEKKKEKKKEQQHSPVARYCLQVSKFRLTMRLVLVSS